MSKLIVEMEMPLNCEHCPMSHWNKLNELTGCDAVGGKRYVSDDDEFWHMARPSWCPIVGVLPPEHGRLIDADDVNNHIIGYVDLRGCPTIVPAEGSET